MRRNDKGLKKMIASLKTLGSQEIQVGIFGDKAKRSVNGSNADNLAYRLEIHDKGLGSNPKREVLDPSIKETLTSDTFIERTLTTNLDKISARVKQNQVGDRAAANLKQGITDLKSPPKKESTILAAQRRYGGRRRTNPLIQTAETRNSVRYRIK